MSERKIRETKIEHLIGRVIIDDEFREILFKNPKRIAELYDLDEKHLKAIMSIGQKTLQNLVKKLDLKILKDAAEIIFCGV